MARHAIVRNADNIVENVAELPAGWPSVPNPWVAPTGTTIVQSNVAGPGDLFSGGNFIPQPQIIPPDPPWMIALRTEVDGTNLSAGAKTLLKKMVNRLS